MKLPAFSKEAAPQAALEHDDRGCQIGSAEEHPQQRHHVKGRPNQHPIAAGAAGGAWRRRSWLAATPMPCSTPQTTNVQLAPCHSPPSSHGDDDVAYVSRVVRGGCRRAECRDSRAANCDSVMCQRRQKSTIESRGVGPQEIVGQPDASMQRQADRHVGVAGEVAIDLRPRSRKSRAALAGAVSRRAGRRSHPPPSAIWIGEHHFLDQARGEDRQPAKAPRRTRVVGAAAESARAAGGSAPRSDAERTACSRAAGRGTPASGNLPRLDVDQIGGEGEGHE